MAVYSYVSIRITPNGIYKNGLLQVAGSYTCGVNRGSSFFAGESDGSVTSVYGFLLNNVLDKGNQTDGLTTPINFMINVGEGTLEGIDRIYYGNQTNHFYTDDDFESIVNLGVYINGQPKSAVYVGNNIVLVGSNTGYVSISSDNCETWTAVPNNPQLSVSSINCLTKIS